VLFIEQDEFRARYYHNKKSIHFELRTSGARTSFVSKAYDDHDQQMILTFGVAFICGAGTNLLTVWLRSEMLCAEIVATIVVPFSVFVARFSRGDAIHNGLIHRKYSNIDPVR
jgi:hypothetical protein